MPFEYIDAVPQYLAANDSGRSMAFPYEFYTSYARLFHKEGYYAGPTFLSKQFSTALLQYYVMCQSGVMIGGGGPVTERAIAPNQFDGTFSFFPCESQMDPRQEMQFFGRLLEHLETLEAFVPKQQKKMLPTDYEEIIKNKTVKGKIQSTFAVYAPVLERMRECKLLHQLGAEFMFIRSITESRQGGNKPLLNDLEEDQKFAYQAYLEDRGNKLKTIIFNMVTFYVQEANAYCEGKRVEDIANTHPPSEFVVRRFTNYFRKMYKKFPSDDDWREFLAKGGDPDELMSDQNLLCNGKEKGLYAGSYDPELMFTPNEIPLPLSITQAISDVYQQGIDGIPDIDMEAVSKLGEYPIIDRRGKKDFKGPPVRAALETRFTCSKELMDAFPILTEVFQVSPQQYQANNVQEAIDVDTETHVAPVVAQKPPIKEEANRPVLMPRSVDEGMTCHDIPIQHQDALISINQQVLLHADALIKESITKTLKRLPNGNKKTALEHAVNALEETVRLGDESVYAKALKDTNSVLYQTLNIKRLIPFTFNGPLGFFKHEARSLQEAIVASRNQSPTPGDH